MQSNIYTSKIIKTSKTKREASENSVKQAYKGKTWKRGTDRREMYSFVTQNNNYDCEAR